MSGAPPAFIEQFQQHLHPRLTNLCIAEATCVAADVTTFEDALQAVMRYARKYGASLLPDHLRYELEDWIVTSLGAAIFEAEAQGYDHWLERNHITGGRVP